MPPDADPRKRQPISSEVIGRFTNSQQRELFTLFGAVFQKKELDPQNPEHVDEAGEIVRDSVMRGIHLRGKVWLAPHESVSRYFESGFNQRTSIIEQLRALGVEGRILEYATEEEEVFTSAVSPYDRNFAPHEQVLAELIEKKASVATLHQRLFEEPPLREQAQGMIDAIHVPEFMVTDDEHTRDDNRIKWVKYNALFGNFLAHLAYYQQPGIIIDAQDIAALSDIWKDKVARQTNQKRLEDAMAGIAHTFNLPEGHIAVYMRNILENMDLALAEGQVTIENLARSTVFALSVEALLTEETIFQERAVRKKARTVTKEMLRRAHTQAADVLARFNHLNELAGGGSDESSEEQDSNQQEFDDYMNNEYTPMLKQLTPLVLYATYYQIQQRDIAANIARSEEIIEPFAPLYEDLEASVPLTTYAEALQVIETADFPDKKAGEIFARIEQFVLSRLSGDRLDEENIFKGVVEKLPVTTLTRFLSVTDVNKMDEMRLSAVLELDEDRWVALALENDVEADLSIAGNPDFVFTGSDFLAEYFDRMPFSKRASLHRKLLHEVEY